MTTEIKKYKTGSMDIVVPDYGVADILVTSAEQIKVQLRDGVLVNGVLYPFTGYMYKHSTGWKFWGPTLQLPKTTPKIREAIISTMTEHVHAYLIKNPDIFRVIEIRIWEKTLEDLQYTQRQDMSRIVSVQTTIESHHRELKVIQDRIEERAQKITEHEATRPYPVVDVAGELAEGEQHGA